MSRIGLTLTIAGALALISLVGDVTPVMAATSDIGKHLGSEIKSWATVLLLGVAGLVAIPVLATRDVNGGLVLALLVVLVGGFAFAPDSVKHAIESLWKSITG